MKQAKIIKSSLNIDGYEFQYRIEGAGQPAFEHSGHSRQYEEPKLFDQELVGWLSQKIAL